MTLRTVHHLGYQIPDLAWLRLREVEYFFDEDSQGEAPSDAAFSF